MVRVVLTSAAAKVCADEAPIPANTDDMGVFKDFFLGLVLEYGRRNVFEMVTADAGFWSLANATTVDDKGYALVFGLKGNKADLHEEARRVLLPLAEGTRDEAEMDWEREKGLKVKRLGAPWNWLTRWKHLRQVWLVLKLRLEDDGTETVIEVCGTNLSRNRLTVSECLEVVRMVSLR